MIDFCEILPALWLGSYPRTRKDINRLNKRSGVNIVLNLQTDADMEYLSIDWKQLTEHYRQRDIEVVRVPIIDFDAADLRRRLPTVTDIMKASLTAGNKVYVHCNLGVNRSPSVVIAYLAWCGGWDLDKAWHHVKERRDCAPSFDAIWLATRDREEKAGA